MIRGDVAVVGGGPAGAIVAAELARRGHDVVVLERSAAWRWHACGVFSSPATLAALGRVGVDDATLRQVARPIPAMRVETRGGTVFRLHYGTAPGSEPVGFDRERLDPLLLGLASDAGARVLRGTRVEAVEAGPGGARLQVRGASGRTVVQARLVIGADGGSSFVARSVGVVGRQLLPERVGLTYHLADRVDDPAADARMRVIQDGYIGIAPVPGGRVNIGIVLGASWRAVLASRGAAAVAASIVADVPVLDGAAGSPRDPAAWQSGTRLDPVAGASPLGHTVRRRGGPGWLLVGDAAGFLDPFTGEGLHRAIVSAELGGRAAHAALRGRPAALEAYDRAMQRRFLAKDAVSWLVQAFLARPALFDYVGRRLEARSGVRETMGLVMGDLVPASRAFDPRFLGALLRP